MLEHEGVLVTWALAELPRVGSSIAATQLANHRLAYLQYEGAISGDRGEVWRIDEGEYEWIERLEERVIVVLQGRTGRIRVELSKRADQTWIAEGSIFEEHDA